MSWRKEELKERLARSERLYSGAEALKIDPTGEEGVRQMRALLGLGDFVTNVNIPNIGQIPNLPFGAVVETNAHFCADTVQPVLAGPLPASIYPLVTRICGIQEMISEAAAQRDMGLGVPGVRVGPQHAAGAGRRQSAVCRHAQNTAAYLTMYQG